jgi:hypothetical protein
MLSPFFWRATGNGCSTEGPYSDTCELDGDVRVNGTALSVAVVPPTRTPRSRVWRIMSYARRNVSDAKAVTVTRLPDRAAAPPCAATHAAPAVLFALGGYTGNYWHDFTDVLVPLFVASRRYGGEVWFLVTRYNPWWLAKYDTLLRRLSRHAAVDIDADTEAPVRCFPHVTVGLEMHREFTIVPDLVLRGGRRRITMADFTAFLREAYALPRGAPARGRPRLLLVHRGHYRRIVNEAEVARAAEAAGFEAVVLEPRGDVRVDEQARLVNSFDVLLGLHGAGLTNAVFLPAGAVLVEVVPYGKLEPMAQREFGGGHGPQVHRLQRRRGGEHAAGDARAGPPGDQGPGFRAPQRLEQSRRVLPRQAGRAHQRHPLRAHAGKGVRLPTPPEVEAGTAHGFQETNICISTYPEK